MGVKLAQLDEEVIPAELEEYSLEVSNISASFELDGEYDLERLSEDLANSEYEPDHHRSLIYRSPNVGSFTVLLPPRGRVSIAGAKSKQEIKRGIPEFVSELGSLGLDDDYRDIRIENVVATGDIGQTVDLNAAVIALGLESTEYEPEQFPGAIYRTEEGVVLIFSSGKVVITSVLTYREVLSAFLEVQEKLSQI
jgi:transcription initiation factor TFIID TATA-box-binding protein